MKKIFLPIVVCSSLLAGAANAATVDSVVVSDFENSILTVQGTIEEGEKGVSILIMKKGQKLDVGDLSGDESSIQNAVINENKYNSTFKFDVAEGVYEVYASNCDTPYEFEYISKESVLQFVEDLGNKTIPLSEIYSKMSRYGGSLGVDLSFAVTEKEQSYLAQNIFDYSQRIKENGIDGVKNVVSLTEAELEFMEKLKEAPAAASVNTLLSEYSESAEIDLSAYNNLTTTEKTKVCLEFVETEYNNMKDFREDFEKEVEDAEDDNSGTGGGGTGGGGSGGGNGSGSNSSNLSTIVNNSTGTTIGTVGNTEEPEGAKLFEMFNDLSDIQWAWEPILYMVDNEIMVGVGDGKFAPDDTLTREQFAKIITLAFGLYNENEVSDFTDISEDHWASSYVASAKKNGIMNGFEDGSFGLGNAISREDICVTIYRAALNAGIEFSGENTDFTDFGEISDYAKEAVSKMAGSGIISGMGDGTFSPKSPATREKTAKIVYSVLNR